VDFQIITPCSRPYNLQFLKASIKKQHNLLWHICFDTATTTEKDRAQAEKTLKEDWIKFYTASCDQQTYGKAQVNFVLTFIRNTDSYIYVLDDDNLLPRNFFDYDYNTKESKVYLFPQQRGNKIVQPQPIVNQIDQAQFLSHASVSSFYENYAYCGDGIHIEKTCNEVPYKCLEQPIVYYNKLR